MGEAPYPGALPPVVMVPLTEFEDETLWLAVSDTMITTANPSDVVIQLDGQHSTMMSRLIPLLLIILMSLMLAQKIIKSL